MIKKIALMTGGGDCAGINAFIAAAVRRGVEGYGAEFLGIRKAFEGAAADNIEEHLIPLDKEAVVGLENKPSSILASSRFNPFSDANRSRNVPQKLLENLKRIGVDAVLATGGDDTIGSAMGLAEMGFPVVAAPKSVDNDVSGTDTMLGFKTAVAFGATAFRSTAESARTHSRISLVEIMGREAGWLALEIGIAGGADVILIPEKAVDLAGLMGRIETIYRRQGYVNIAVAEGLKISPEDPLLQEARAEIPVVRALLEEDLGRDAHGNPKLGGVGQLLRRIICHRLGLKKLEKVRATDLGYTLRGLAPIADDVILGTRFGLAAVDYLFAGVTGRMTGLQGTRIVPVPFADALVPKTVDWLDQELESAGVYCQRSAEAAWGRVRETGG
ncbi:6-phosphofructokinase [Limnochorda pilosa]|uniref:6-phosphofructokinase n=1 Tax=Limnochorda pilosa TaxID=1555112 RepID=A0A0K2SGV4_LIMPI|nr:ATP-dependent 6-phosphofructokinase [Limnochorda pilosa]BAS26346.1 6-phosphofructokinase [Limnochorda pilosa]